MRKLRLKQNEVKKKNYSQLVLEGGSLEIKKREVELG